MLFVPVAFKKSFYYWIIYYLLLSYPIVGYPETIHFSKDEQALFFKAEHAIRLNDSVMTEKLLSKLIDTPLYNYLEYQKIKKDIVNNQNKKTIFYSHPIDINIILNYRNTYPNSPLSDKLFYFWIQRQAAEKRWDTFLAALNPNDTLSHSIDLQCYKLYAQYYTKPEPDILKSALSLWTHIQNHSSACVPLFELLHEEGLINQDKLLKKHRLLIERKTPQSLNLAKSLKSYMHPEYQAIASTWENWLKNPSQITNQSLVNKLTKYRNQIIVSSFKQYAKLNPRQASKVFEEKISTLNLTSFEIGEIVKQMALSLALQHDPKAAFWFSKIPKTQLDNKTREWQIRTALRNADWQQVLHYLDQLDHTQSQQARWQYWRARALEALQLSGYRTIYSQLAQDRSYYGFLAAERIDQVIQLNHRPLPYSSEAMNNLENRLAILRIKALFDINRPIDAHREWYYMIASMDTPEKIHAARLAQKLKWYHLAIYTFNQSEYKDDIILRFPLAYEKNIINAAQAHQMDSAWLFAIARQESNFNALAISPVGAIGLMQLMPKTAQVIHPGRIAHLSEPHINITLGTRYLRTLRDQLKNPILVTAAYNAGPSRVKRWLPIESCAGDVWIETIPFEETRHYVENVLAYTCIYKTLQNKRFLLSKMMPYVHPL